MFWGLVVEPGKKYTQTVEKSFHLSMACLELNKNENEAVSLILYYEGQEYILCNLHCHKKMQCQLDLIFQFGEKISFYSAGKSRVHLSGYLVNEDDLEVSDEEENEEEDEEASPAESLQKKRKEVSSNLSGIKKLKLDIPEGYEENDETLKDDDSEAEEDEDDEDEEEEEDDDDDENEEEEEEGEDSDEQQQLVLKFQQNKMTGGSPKKQVPGQILKSPNQQNGQVHTQSEKRKKNQPGDTPKSDSSTGTPQKKVLQGGVIVQDVKVGNGQAAKPGKQISVYYIGRLKQNNKQFDASTNGPGFKFTLSRGQVIKGWDIGIAGMQVGGKRTITIPPQMAYGKKGMPPAIPPNSVLVFDVELKSVH